MIIENLVEKFGRIKTAGFMAEAALSLGYVVDEESIISQIVDEVRIQLGINRDDNEPDTLSRVGDFLDSESDKLLHHPAIVEHHRYEDEDE